MKNPLNLLRQLLMRQKQSLSLGFRMYKGCRWGFGMWWHHAFRPKKNWIIRTPGGHLHTRGRQSLGAITQLYKPGFYIDDGKSDRQVRTIIDCGANIGTQVARFRFHHPDAQILAIEPHPGNFELLEQSFLSDDHVSCMKKAIWPTPQKLKIFHKKGTTPDTSVNFFEGFQVAEGDGGREAGGEEVDIEGITLNECMENLGWDEIDILKIDIEGAEHALFKEPDVAWLSKVNCLIFEPPDADHAGTTQLIFKRLEDYGLKFEVTSGGEYFVLIKEGLDWRNQIVFGFNLSPRNHTHL